MVDMTTYAPPSDSMAVFCDAVKTRLRLLRISQGELARRLDISAPTLSQLLQGKAGNCSLKRCDEIAAALDTTTIDLLTERH